ncbi:MAG: bifunctional phosphoglucose/phosphomannose isomerase [bacterium]|nr:bifunctional phosphoglucose/phosphomannose isomerase [bacterium]
MIKVNAIDKSNMRQMILDFPKQFRAGLFAAERITLPKLRLRSPIVICGMGGSASVGDLFKLWMRHEYIGFSEYEVIIHRGYGLPKLEFRYYEDGTWEPLIIAISYSGNTEETLSAYEMAKKRGLPTIAMSTGGKLKELAMQDKTPFVQIPITHIPPRASFGYQFGALAALLKNLQIMDSKNHHIADLHITLDAAALESEGKKLAKKFANIVPILYASDAWKELAQIIKIKFNEHAKWPAFWNYFPELNHNEMVGYASLSDRGSKIKAELFHLLMLRDASDHPRTKKRMELTAKLLREKGIDSTFINIKGRTVLEKIFTMLILGDWIAYHHAVLRGIDPAPVELVEKFKKSMG